MFIFINSTDVEVWRNITRLRKLVDLLENTTLEASAGPNGNSWNFSDAEQIAAYVNQSIGTSTTTHRND